MEASYSSIPKIRSPYKTVVILSILTLGCYLWWRHSNDTYTENEEK